MATEQHERDQFAMKNFEDTLRRLAASAEEQTAYLREIGMGTAPTKLALEFGDCAMMIPGLVARGVLPADQASALQELDDALREMSGEDNAALSTTEALAC